MELKKFEVNFSLTNSYGPVLTTVVQAQAFMFVRRMIEGQYGGPNAVNILNIREIL